MPGFIFAIVAAIRVFFRRRRATALEILALRQQAAVLKRKRPRPPWNSFDRLFWATLRHFWTRWREVLVILKPETVAGWHRAGFRSYWRWRSRRPTGRPKIAGWVVQQLREAFPEASPYRYVIFDRDSKSERWAGSCRRDGLLASGSRAEQAVDRLNRWRSGQVWSHITSSEYLSQVQPRREILL